jgi:hypothetical protein
MLFKDYMKSLKLNLNEICYLIFSKKEIFVIYFCLFVAQYQSNYQNLISRNYSNRTYPIWNIYNIYS